MSKNVKSLVIIKTIFSFANELPKLHLIKYNKHLQEILYIDISNYRHFKGKYINYDSDRKGKEYNGYDDRLIFEGEYLNGRRNGKGKEYNDEGRLIFEGEYLNGKRNGKGKEYDNEGRLKFEGEYLKGKRNGKGKEYPRFGNLRSEIEYLKGKELKRTIYDNNGNAILHQYNLFGNVFGYRKKSNENVQFKFETEYLNGEKWNEKVKEYNSTDNLIFVGEYINGKRNGNEKNMI